MTNPSDWIVCPECGSENAVIVDWRPDDDTTLAALIVTQIAMLATMTTMPRCYTVTEHECPVCGWEPDSDQPYPEDALIHHYERTDHNPEARE